MIIVVGQSDYGQACTAAQLLCLLAFYLAGIKRRIIEPIKALMHKVRSTNVGERDIEGTMRLDSLYVTVWALPRSF